MNYIEYNRQLVLHDLGFPADKDILMIHNYLENRFSGLYKKSSILDSTVEYCDNNGNEIFDIDDKYLIIYADEQYKSVNYNELSLSEQIKYYDDIYKLSLLEKIRKTIYNLDHVDIILNIIVKKYNIDIGKKQIINLLF